MIRCRDGVELISVQQLLVSKCVYKTADLTSNKTDTSGAVPY